MEPEELLAGNPVALAVFERVRSALESLGPVEVRASKSQVAFRRLRGFAYLWVPGHYLKRPGADVVLSWSTGFERRQNGLGEALAVVEPCVARYALPPASPR